VMTGSPPRARGQRTRWLARTAWPPAHPRVRGANLRGLGRHRRRERLTPACAGPTRSAWAGRSHSAAHPRVRGANVRLLAQAVGV